MVNSLTRVRYSCNVKYVVLLGELLAEHLASLMIVDRVMFMIRRS